MRAIGVLVVLLVLAILGCASGGRRDPSPAADRVLFVGNSLTYVGNLPAVFAALADAGGRAVAADMIVAGGATLSERVADGTVAQALAEGRYTAVVLQERGGDLLCAFGAESCAESRRAIGELARLAKRHGATAVLLGTYQARPEASRALIDAEARAAAEAGIGYVALSGILQRLRRTHPQLAWFASDGVHPGKDLTLLGALLLHRQLYGALPAAAPLSVGAPIYGVSSGLAPTVRAADAPPPRADTPLGVRYHADTVAPLRRALDDGRAP